MSWLNGVYTRIHNWVDDEASEIDIEASRMDAEDDSIAAGINDCLKKDGTNSATLINIDNLRLDGNTLSSTDTDGNIELTPNGAGLVNIAKDDLAIGGVAVTITAEEANLLDGVTSVADIVYDDDIAVGGDFSSGSVHLLAVRGNAGYHCTLTVNQNLPHSSDYTASTGTIIPSTYWPSVATTNAYATGASAVKEISVSLGGNITFQYNDNTGNNRNDIGTITGCSVSWYVAD